MNAKTWVSALRPKTLTAAIIPIAVATALTKHDGYPVQWWISLYALLSSIFIQIATNLINDAIDFKRGADTHERIGPRRVTQSGLLTGRTVMAAGLLSLFIAACLGIPLLQQGGWPILGIGLVSLFLGYAYTGGPYPLAYKGLGDIFVILFFGLIAVGGVYYLQTGSLSEGAVIAGLQVGLLATVLLAVNNLRDVDGDRKVHKKTLAVRFGLRFARFEIALCACLPFVINAYWGSSSRIPEYLPLMMLPAAIYLVRGINAHHPGPIYNRYLALGAFLHMGFGLLLSIGLW